MSLSNRLALPFIDAAQSQKHVTHNEALAALDALVHLSVKARNVAAPPATPAEGDRYLVGAGATGVFVGKTNTIAAFDNGGWAFLSPRAGWRSYVESEGLLLLYDGSSWNDVGLSLHALQNMSLLGIGATADASNPLSAKVNAALFTAKSTGEGGTGDLRFTLNKSASGNTVSQLYETNYSGRAETGLTGDDHFHVKVSPDGSTWKEAINVDPSTGDVKVGRIVAQSATPSTVPLTVQGIAGQSADIAAIYKPDGAYALRVDSSGNVSVYSAFSTTSFYPTGDMSLVSGTYYARTAGKGFSGGSTGFLRFTDSSDGAGGAPRFEVRTDASNNGLMRVSVDGSAWVNAVVIDNATGGVTLSAAPLKTAIYTVATLPTGSTGMRAFVTDALSPAFGMAVAGGGGVGVPVYYANGSWKVG